MNQKNLIIVTSLCSIIIISTLVFLSSTAQSQNIHTLDQLRQTTLPDVQSDKPLFNPDTGVTVTPTPNAYGPTSSAPSVTTEGVITSLSLTIPEKVIDLDPTAASENKSGLVIRHKVGHLIEYRMLPIHEDAFVSKLSIGDIIVVYMPSYSTIIRPHYDLTPTAWIVPYPSGTPTPLPLSPTVTRETSVVIIENK